MLLGNNTFLRITYIAQGIKYPFYFNEKATTIIPLIKDDRKKAKDATLIDAYDQLRKKWYDEFMACRLPKRMKQSNDDGTNKDLDVLDPDEGF